MRRGSPSGLHQYLASSKAYVLKIVTNQLILRSSTQIFSPSPDQALYSQFTYVLDLAVIAGTVLLYTAPGLEASEALKLVQKLLGYGCSASKKFALAREAENVASRLKPSLLSLFHSSFLVAGKK